MRTSLKTLDLFAGVGGMRFAFEQEGFEAVFANDNDKYCKETYDLNFAEPTLHLADIQDIEPSDLPDFDILLGGFPCQPFSVAGEKKGFGDKERGGLFFQVMKIIKARQPRAIFLENVKHLVGHDNGKTYSIIKDSLEKAGYLVKEDIINSAKHGNIPQNRERVYIAAFLSEEDLQRFRFPGEIPLARGAFDFIEDGADKRYYYSRDSWLCNKISEGSVAMRRNRIYQWRRTYLRESMSGLCFTLTANMGGGGHNVPLIRDKKGIRRLTPRECARLQGFSDSFQFPQGMSDTQAYKQVGNAVTIPVVRRIAARMRKALMPSRAGKDSARPVKLFAHGRRVRQEEAERDHVEDPLKEYAR